jgi:hypothetical protein
MKAKFSSRSLYWLGLGATGLLAIVMIIALPRRISDPKIAEAVLHFHLSCEHPHDEGKQAFIAEIINPSKMTVVLSAQRNRFEGVFRVFHEGMQYAFRDRSYQNDRLFGPWETERITLAPGESIRWRVRVTDLDCSSFKGDLSDILGETSVFAKFEVLTLIPQHGEYSSGNLKLTSNCYFEPH